MLIQNIIGLLQLPQANEKCAEGYIMCKDLSLVSKAKGHCRSTNEKKTMREIYHPIIVCVCQVQKSHPLPVITMLMLQMVIRL